LIDALLKAGIHNPGDDFPVNGIGKRYRAFSRDDAQIATVTQVVVGAVKLYIAPVNDVQYNGFHTRVIQLIRQAV